MSDIPEQPLEDEPYLSANDMAEKLGVVASTLKTWIKRGAITPDCFILVGTTYRFAPKATKAALKQHTADRIHERNKDNDDSQLSLFTTEK